MNKEKKCSSPMIDEPTVFELLSEKVTVELSSAINKVVQELSGDQIEELTKINEELIEENTELGKKVDDRLHARRIANFRALKQKISFLDNKLEEMSKEKEQLKQQILELTVNKNNNQQIKDVQHMEQEQGQDSINEKDESDESSSDESSSDDESSSSSSDEEPPKPVKYIRRKINKRGDTVRYAVYADGSVFTIKDGVAHEFVGEYDSELKKFTPAN